MSMSREATLVDAEDEFVEGNPYDGNGGVGFAERGGGGGVVAEDGSMTVSTSHSKRIAAVGVDRYTTARRPSSSLAHATPPPAATPPPPPLAPSPLATNDGRWVSDRNGGAAAMPPPIVAAALRLPAVPEHAAAATTEGGAIAPQPLPPLAAPMAASAGVRMATRRI